MILTPQSPQDRNMQCHDASDLSSGYCQQNVCEDLGGTHQFSEAEEFLPFLGQFDIVYSSLPPVCISANLDPQCPRHNLMAETYANYPNPFLLKSLSGIINELLDPWSIGE